MPTKKQNNDILTDILAEISLEEQERTNKRMLLAARIDDARKKKGWNRKEFAERMGQQPSVISKWLSGTHNFTTDTLFVLEEKLGVKLLQVEAEKKTAEINFYFQTSVQDISERTRENDLDIHILGGDQFFHSQNGIEC